MRNTIKAMDAVMEFVPEQVEETKNGYEVLLDKWRGEIDNNEEVVALYQELPGGKVLKDHAPKYLLDLSNPLRPFAGGRGLYGGYSESGVQIVAKIGVKSERIEREAKVLGRVEHPNVVTAYDLLSKQKWGGEEVDILIIRGVEGGTMLDLFRRIELGEEKLSKEKFLRIMDGLGRGIAWIHEQGLAHADLHDRNVMFNLEGEVKIIDFDSSIGAKELGMYKERDISDYMTKIGELLVGKSIWDFRIRGEEPVYEKAVSLMEGRCAFTVSEEKWKSFLDFYQRALKAELDPEYRLGIKEVREKMMDLFGNLE